MEANENVQVAKLVLNGDADYAAVTVLVYADGDLMIKKDEDCIVLSAAQQQLLKRMLEG